MKNFQLYARILRLVTDFAPDCQRSAPQLFDVARDVIATDAGLVWC